MLKGSGLVITIRLLNSNICTSALNVKGDLASATVAARIVQFAQKQVPLSLSNIYMQNVYMTRTVQLVRQPTLLYETYNDHIRAGNASLSYNEVFSLNGMCFLKGIFIVHTPSQKFSAVDTKGESIKTPTKAAWNDIMPAFSTGQLNYC